MAEPAIAEPTSSPAAIPPAGVGDVAPAVSSEAGAAAPVAAPAAAAPPPVELKQELAADKPTLLETVGKDDKPPAASDKPKEEVAKPADEPAAESAPDVKPEAPKPEVSRETEAKPEVKAPEADLAPIEYKFELPESIKANDEKMAAFTDLLGGARVPAEVGQKLVNLHSDAMSAYAEHMGREQQRVFSETRDGWRKEVMADHEIGGSGHDTAMRAIARARDALVSSAKPGTEQYQSDMAALETMLRVTGAGDHPVFLRMLHRAARFVDEPQAESLPANISPPKGNGRRPGGLYPHPSSQNMGK